MKIEHIIAVGGRHWLRHAGGDPCFYLEVASDHCPVCRAERERDGIEAIALHRWEVIRERQQRIRQLERERDGWRADAEREGKNVIFHRENHDEAKRRLEEAVEMLVQLRDRLSEVACDADRLLAGVDAARAAGEGVGDE